jgi:hypothetical protein
MAPHSNGRSKPLLAALDPSVAQTAKRYIVAGLVLWPHFEAPKIINITAALLAAKYQNRCALILFAGKWLYELLGVWYGWTDLLTHIETTSADQVGLTGHSQTNALMCTVVCLCFLYGAL